MATSVITTLITKLKYTADTKGLKDSEKGLSKLGRSTNFLNARLGSLKGVLFGLVGAFAVFKSIDAFTDEQEAVENLTQSLKNVGKAAPVSLKELQAFADKQEELTKVGDEQILGGISQPLILSGVAKTKAQFFQIQKIILNLSAATKQSAAGSAKVVISSLSRTGGELGLLSAAGIKVTDSFKGQLAAMDKTGNQAQAVQLVLDLLTKKLKGIAAANATTVSGSFITLKDQVGDFSKTIGQLILTTLNPFVKLLTKLFMLLNSSKALQNSIGVVAALGATLIGVTLAVKAFKLALLLLSPIIKIITFSIELMRAAVLGLEIISAIFSPVLLVFAAIVAVIAAIILNFKFFKKIVLEVVDFIVKEFNKALSIVKKFLNLFEKTKGSKNAGIVNPTEKKQFKSEFKPILSDPTVSSFSKLVSPQGNKTAQTNNITMTINSNQADPSAVADQVNKTLKQHIRGAALTLDSSIKN